MSIPVIYHGHNQNEFFPRQRLQTLLTTPATTENKDALLLKTAALYPELSKYLPSDAGFAPEVYNDLINSETATDSKRISAEVLLAARSWFVPLESYVYRTFFTNLYYNAMSRNTIDEYYRLRFEFGQAAARLLEKHKVKLPDNATYAIGIYKYGKRVYWDGALTVPFVGTQINVPYPLTDRNFFSVSLPKPNDVYERDQWRTLRGVKTVISKLYPLYPDLAKALDEYGIIIRIYVYAAESSVVFG